jgi:peptide deformylase
MKLVQASNDPDKILTTPTEPVEDFTEAKTIELKLRAMIRVEGDLVGLAANQVGIKKAVCVCALDGEWVTMVNPKITHSSIGKAEDVEGCGSLRKPKALYALVRRPIEIHVAYQDVAGKNQWFKLRDFAARVAQHEIDHLNGIMITDRGELVDGTPQE